MTLRTAPFGFFSVKIPHSPAAKGRNAKAAR